MADFEVSTIAESVHAAEETTPVSDKKSSLPWYRRLDQTKGILLLLICMAQMLDIINIASVTIALPSILRDVGYHPNQLQWIVSSYALTYSAFLLVGGRMVSGGFLISILFRCCRRVCAARSEQFG